MKYKHAIEIRYLNNCIINSKIKLKSILLGLVGEMISLNIGSKSNRNKI